MEPKKVTFNGDVYVRNPNSRYYFKHTTRNEDRRNAKQLHKAVWEFYNGPIPDGYHIHHIDHDVDNNDISNLECIEASEHLSMHGRMNAENPDWRSRNREQLNLARKKASEWHSSDEGIKWHQEHAKESLAHAWEKESRVCEECGKVFVGTKRSRFCSQLCGQRSRARRNGQTIRPLEGRVCAYCGRGFTATNGVQKYCSQKCANESYKDRRRRGTLENESNTKERRVYCLETETTYKSGKEAASALGVSAGQISSVCNGHYRSTHGYHVMFADE